jgi:hypothetical protein
VKGTARRGVLASRHYVEEISLLVRSLLPFVEMLLDAVLERLRVVGFADEEVEDLRLGAFADAGQPL